MSKSAYNTSLDKAYKELQESKKSYYDVKKNFEIAKNYIEKHCEIPKETMDFINNYGLFPDELNEQDRKMIKPGIFCIFKNNFKNEIYTFSKYTLIIKGLSELKKEIGMK